MGSASLAAQLVEHDLVRMSRSSWNFATAIAP